MTYILGLKKEFYITENGKEMKKLGKFRTKTYALRVLNSLKKDFSESKFDIGEVIV